MKGLLAASVIGLSVVQSVDIPTLTHSKCYDYISTTSRYTSFQCMTDCDDLMQTVEDPTSDSQFASRCAYFAARVSDQRAVPTGAPCGENLVYGLAPTADTLPHLTQYTVSTLALCKALCETQDDCVHYTWRSPSSVGDSDAKRCLLKTREAILNAYDTTTQVSQWCTLPFFADCGSSRVCKQCHGRSQCIYSAGRIISGWRDCVQPDDLAPCVDTTTSTEATTSTTELTTSTTSTTTPATTSTATTSTIEVTTSTPKRPRYCARHGH